MNQEIIVHLTDGTSACVKGRVHGIGDTLWSYDMDGNVTNIWPLTAVDRVEYVKSIGSNIVPGKAAQDG